MQRQISHNHDTSVIAPLAKNLVELLPREWPINVPLVRISTCGQLVIEVVHEIDQTIGTGRTFTYGSPQLPQHGAVTALNLLKLLVSQPSRFATKDWLTEKLRRNKSAREEWEGLARLDNIVSILRSLLCPLDIQQKKLVGRFLLEYVPATPDSGSGYRLASYPHIWLDVEALNSYAKLACQMESEGQDAWIEWQRVYRIGNRGAFLAEGQYSDWAVRRREEVEGYLWQSVQALWRIASRREESGEEEVLRLLRDYWLRHPENEDAFQPLVELLGKRENYQRAEEYYAKLCGALREEGKEPNIRTLKTMNFLRTHRNQPELKRVNQPGTLQSRPFFFHSTKQAVVQEPFPSFVTAESVMSGVVTLPTPVVGLAPSVETMIPDGAARFGILLAQTITLIQSWSGMAKFCHHLQDQLDQMIKGLSMLKSSTSLEAYTLSRRSFLITLAALPTSLLQSSKQAHKLNIEIEQFLPQCAASILACWHLSSESHLDTISPIIDSYLPTLVALMEIVPSYREITADLIAQCYFLKTILAWHVEGLSIAEAYCTQAMHYSDIADNTNLRLTALNQYALIAYYAKQFPKALRKSEEALATLHDAPHEHIFPIVQGRVYMYLAAIQGQQQQGDPKKTIESARQAFMRQAAVVEQVPLYADCGDAPLTLWDGLTQYHLGVHKRTRTNAGLNALRIFGQLEASTKIPERFRLECLTNRTLAAIQCNELEEAIACFEAGKKGAEGLGSQQRIAEVAYSYQRMGQQWPHEARVKHLETVSIQKQ